MPATVTELCAQLACDLEVFYLHTLARFDGAEVTNAAREVQAQLCAIEPQWTNPDSYAAVSGGETSYLGFHAPSMHAAVIQAGIYVVQMSQGYSSLEPKALSAPIPHIAQRPWWFEHGRLRGVPRPNREATCAILERERVRLQQVDADLEIEARDAALSGDERDILDALNRCGALAVGEVSDTARLHNRNRAGTLLRKLENDGYTVKVDAGYAISASGLRAIRRAETVQKQCN